MEELVRLITQALLIEALEIRFITDYTNVAFIFEVEEAGYFDSAKDVQGMLVGEDWIGYGFYEVTSVGVF